MKVVDVYHFPEDGFVLVNGIEEVRARHVETKQVFTIKRINLSNEDNLYKYNYIIHQLTILNKLELKCTVKCHKMLKTAHNIYVVFDELKGIPLSHLIEKSFDQKKAVHIIQQICIGLKQLQRSSICHGGLNPESIIVQDNDNIKFINFGFAEQLSNGYSQLGQRHHSQIISDYTAPEIKQMKMFSKTDIFSLGVIIKNIFLTKKHNNEKLSLLVSEMIESQIEKRPNIEKVIDFFKSKQLKKVEFQQIPISSQKIVQFKTEHDQKTVIDVRDRSKSLQKSDDIKKKRRATTGQRPFFDQDLMVIYRKVLQKRNFSQLMLQMAEFCSNSKQVQSEKCSVLSFMLVKKSTIVISQLTKFMETGGGIGMRMDSKLKQRVSKKALFITLEQIIRKEMTYLRQRLSLLVQGIKLMVEEKETNHFLQRELQSQSIDNEYLRSCVGIFLNELLFWSQSRHTKSEAAINCQIIEGFSKKQLVLIFIFGQLAQYDRFEQFFDRYFSQSGCPLWQELFLQKAINLSDSDLSELILSQKSIKSRIDLDIRSKTKSPRALSSHSLCKKSTSKVTFMQKKSS